MNDDLEQKVNELGRKINEMYAWFQARQRQFIPYPVDEASRNALGAVTKVGAGSSDLTDTISTAGATATVPAAYAGSIIVSMNGENYELPYL